jgi:ParB family chromosome partitioning protein
MAAEKRKALGRGLDALLPGEEEDVRERRATPPEPDPAEGKISRVAPGRLRPGLHQPRTDFDEDALKELSESVRRSGIIQPILARRSGDGFEIVAGERRWRAAVMAGLETVPLLLMEAAGAEALEVAVIENLQRTDLNPIEEASAYMSMMERLGLTQEEVAARVGKDRSTVANYVRLLKLPAEVQEDVGAGNLSMGHARALLSLRSDDETKAFSREAVQKELSVRQLEDRIRKVLAVRAAGGAKYPHLVKEGEPTGPQALFLREIRERLRAALGTKVQISGDEKKGKIVIEYYSAENLEGIVEKLV